MSTTDDKRLHDECEDVKPRNRREAFLHWVDCHPRVGWYIALLSTLNVFLTTLELFK